jgi:anti-anti-sigma regulatory factor
MFFWRVLRDLLGVDRVADRVAGWHITRDGHGLRLRPLRQTLDYADLRAAVHYARREGLLRGGGLTLDLSAVQAIGSPWTAVFAFVIDLARTLPGGCRLVDAQPGPAALAHLLLRDVSPALVRVEVSAPLRRAS